MSRIKTLQTKLKEKKLQSILITSKENLRYFTNFTGSKGYLLITQKKAVFMTDFRYTEAAKKCVPKEVTVIEVEKKFKNFETVLKKYRIKTLGIEDDKMTLLQNKSLKKKAKGVKFKSTYPLLLKLREKKEQQEIALLKKSQKLNEKVLAHIIKKHLKPGVTEKEIVWQIEKTAHELGAEKLAFPPIIAFGKNSSMPHHNSGDTKLKKGDVILIDMGMVVNGYHSDMSRTFFTTKPTKKQKEIYEIVLKAQEKAIAHLKPGLTGKKIDSLARKVIEKAGYGTNFGHGAGHGTGLQIHELPSLSQNYTKKAEESAVIAIEPGIYIKNSFGVRIEDMVIIQSNKPTNITHFPKGLNAAIIKI